MCTVRVLSRVTVADTDFGQSYLGKGGNYSMCTVHVLSYTYVLPLVCFVATQSH